MTQLLTDPVLRCDICIIDPRFKQAFQSTAECSWPACPGHGNFNMTTTFEYYTVLQMTICLDGGQLEY